MDKNKSVREYYLDWIRVIIVLILVPYHTAVSFSHIGKGYIYSAQPVDSHFFTFLSDFLNLWFMRMLFFISGVASSLALRKRSTKEFVLERLRRLLVPVIFSILVIGPLSGYILAINHYDFSGNFFAFYPLFFIEIKRYLFWGHMWFCVYLLIFSLSVLPLLKLSAKRSHVFQRVNSFLTRKNYILLPMILIVLLETLLRPHYPGFQSFWGDWANVAVYLTFYLLGYLFWQTPGVMAVITQKRFLFLSIAIISTIFHIYFKRYYSPENGLNLILSSFFWGSGAYCWVLFILGLFKIYMNNPSGLLGYLSNSSFSLYLFHYLLLSVINYFLIKTAIDPHIIWGITSAATYPLFYLLYEILLKRVGILRAIGGIKL